MYTKKYTISVLKYKTYNMTGFEQVYWITRFDSMRILFGVFIGVSIAAIIIYLVGSGGILADYDKEDDTYKNWMNFWKKKFIAIFIFLSIGVFGIIFVPSKNDALLIMGGGTVLEYIENNEDLGKIPDNAIKALSEWSDNFLEEQRTKH